jgi:hypothetical protein
MKMSKADKEKHADQVRNEGLQIKPTEKLNAQTEIVMELEEEGAAAKVAEEGAKTIQDTSEFQKLNK